MNYKLKQTPMPTKVGLYWARQIECSPDSEDYIDFEAKISIEPVAVSANDRRASDPSHFCVFVLGDSKTHPLEYFEWYGPVELNGKPVESNFA